MSAQTLLCLAVVLSLEATMSWYQPFCTTHTSTPLKTSVTVQTHCSTYGHGEVSALCCIAATGILRQPDAPIETFSGQKHWFKTKNGPVYLFRQTQMAVRTCTLILQVIPAEHGPDRRHKRVDLNVNPAITVFLQLLSFSFSPVLSSTRPGLRLPVSVAHERIASVDLVSRRESGSMSSTANS